MKKFTTLQEDLRNWFDPKHPEGGWKRVNSKGEAIGPCAREPGEAKPKCMSNEKRAALSKKERAAAVRSKRKHDPNPERKGKPINVSNFGKGKLSESMEQLDEKNVPTNPELWSKAKSLAKSKFDVYPSAYANGWAAKWYKSKGGGWKSVNEESEQVSEQHREKGRFKPIKPHNVPETPGAMLRKEQNDTQEKVEMTQSQLHFIGYACDEILDYIKMGGEVEEWYQVKVAKAFSEFESLHAFIEGEKRRTGMVKEESQLDEISAQTKSAYTLKAKQQIGDLEPHAKKGEYKDLAKSLIAKRKKGLAMAEENTDGKTEVEKNIEKTKKTFPNVKHFTKSGHPDWKKHGFKDMPVKEEVINEDDLPVTSNKSKTVTVKHKTSGKELNVVDTPSVREKYKKMDYHPVKEEAEKVQEAEKIQKHRPGWMARMIKRDNPEIAAKMNQGKEMNKLMHKYGGKTSDEIAKMKKEDADFPFEGGKPAKGTVTDKSGAKHSPMSRVRDLARKALEKQKQGMKPVVKESETESRKKQIVKDAAKNASKKTKDNFDPDPELSSEISKQ